jgi:hypothetical protein
MNLLPRITRTPGIKRMLLAAARVRAARFQGQDPLAAQRRIFSELVAKGSATRFGRDYDLGRIVGLPFESAYRYFRSTVPIRPYQQFWSDYFARHNDGRAIRLENLTWPGRITLFCETSGTTAPTKHIPFSHQMFAENRRAGLDLISCYLAAHPESAILDGKILYMSGSTALSELEPGVYSGDMSAITLRFRPWYLTPYIEPAPTVSALPWDDKLQAMAELLLSDRSIRVISGVPPWILLLLKRCCELSGGKSPAEVLPNLELIIHGGTSIKPYRAEFASLFGTAAPNFIEVLPSSEAFMGFQCAGENGMRLTPYYGAFYEFVRFEDLDDNGHPAPDAPVVPLEEVEAGQRYAVILTTCSGLWRYHIGDTLRFTGRAPYLIEFTGRDRFLDKLEEKVTQEEVERVVADLNHAGLCRINEFMVGADVAQRRHVWVVAGARAAAPAQEEVAHFIDRRLRELNADYGTFRQQGRIRFPEVLPVEQEAIYDWSRQVRGKLGGQSKIPHIDPTADASMIMGLKHFIETRLPSASA